MPRPNWSERYQRQVRSRGKYVHPKIYGTTPRVARPATVQISTKTWALVSASLAVCALGWFLFASPAFAIRRIDVVGAVTPDVVAEIQSLQGKNLLRYSTGSMTGRLRQSQSSIRDLTVFKGLPDTLRIEIGLRDAVLRWQSTDQEYLIDAAGIPFRRGAGYTETTTQASAPLVVDTAGQPVVVGKPIVSQQFSDFVRQANREFPSRFPLEVDRFELGESTFEVRLVTKDGWYVFFDTNRPVEAQLDALGKVFTAFHDDIKQYVDLRIEGRAYYQ